VPRKDGNSKWGKAEYWHCSVCGLPNYDNHTNTQRCARCAAPRGKAPPLKASQRRAILARDGRQCSWPGCESRKNLEVHHLQWRHFGGGNDSLNLVTLCRYHHHKLHPGMAEAARKAAQGSKGVYEEYAKVIRQMHEQPRVQMAYVLLGIVEERERRK